MRRRSHFRYHLQVTASAVVHVNCEIRRNGVMPFKHSVRSLLRCLACTIPFGAIARELSHLPRIKVNEGEIAAFCNEETVRSDKGNVSKWLRWHNSREQDTAHAPAWCYFPILCLPCDLYWHSRIAFTSWGNRFNIRGLNLVLWFYLFLLQSAKRPW